MTESLCARLHDKPTCRFHLRVVTWPLLQARSLAPAIIFIDEIDAVGRTRGGAQGNDERDQTLNQMLSEMDGFQNSSQVIVMAATNRRVRPTHLTRPCCTMLAFFMLLSAHRDPCTCSFPAPTGARRSSTACFKTMSCLPFPLLPPVHFPDSWNQPLRGQPMPSWAVSLSERVLYVLGGLRTDVLGTGRMSWTRPWLGQEDLTALSMWGSQTSRAALRS